MWNMINLWHKQFKRNVIADMDGGKNPYGKNSVELNCKKKKKMMLMMKKKGKTVSANGYRAM